MVLISYYGSQDMVYVVVFGFRPIMSVRKFNKRTSSSMSCNIRKVETGIRRVTCFPKHNITTHVARGVDERIVLEPLKDRCLREYRFTDATVYEGRDS